VVEAERLQLERFGAGLDGDEPVVGDGVGGGDVGMMR